MTSDFPMLACSAGTFDVRLEFTLDQNLPGLPAESSETAGVTLFTAIQEQLGLRLESQKGPVEIIVIDRLEKPSAN